MSNSTATAASEYIAVTDPEPPDDLEPPPKESIWAAGCVVARIGRNGDPEYLIVHRPRYHDWTLPKGKNDKGETLLETALRELKEETGIKGRKPRLIGSVGYITKTDNAKVVRWWLVKGGKEDFTPNSEVDKARWVSLKKGRRKLTYRNDRKVLDRANDLYLSKSAGMIYLLRHAWAGARDDSDPDDRLRKLDKRGKRQRQVIRDLLMAHPITRIGSSNYPRCVATVKPLAKRLGVPLELEAALVEGSHPHRLVGLIAQLQEQSAVLCTHGDVIADLIGHLFAEGVPMDGPMEWEKGSIWELRTIHGRVVSGRYLSPTS